VTLTPAGRSTVRYLALRQLCLALKPDAVRFGRPEQPFFRAVQPPERPDAWAVITDWGTGFSGREEQAAAISDILMPWLSSLTLG
jgi:hypothetical protein